MEDWASLLLTSRETDALEATKPSNIPSIKDISSLCQQTLAVLSKDTSSFVDVTAPVTVVGDIHGQLYDLLELMKVGGPAPDTNYLFLGDYVDRGYYSVETILLLFHLRVQFPDQITLLRGNHETRQITQVYGFYDECVKKFNGSPEVWKLVTGVFDYLPVAALVSGPRYNVLALHAGLSPSIHSLDDLRNLVCKSEVPHEGAACDLLWSDPDETCQGWGVSQRGAGFIFGADVVLNFNHVNNLDMLCRSHQLVMDGYKEIFDGQLTTVWSAPNYCYRCGNMAAILQLGESSFSYDTFSQAPDSLRASPNTESVPVDYFL